MSTRSLGLSDAVYDYLLQHSLREPELLTVLREETASHPRHAMQISPEQGQLMGLLVELIGARRAIEVGVFTGYSALRVALSLPPDGRLLACDVSDEYTQIARRYFAAAGVAEKVELVIAPAAETLAARLAAGEAGSYDFAFIDADKPGYDTYYEACLELLRPGGLVVIDNVLWEGQVADPTDQEASTLAIRALNQKIHRDARVTQSMLPVGDGLTLARKR
ncbi:MAG: class I SAM-dependent methyltransferase [Polyangiaceae bacterium]|nr:class I SAM-dependent methyltransferase [Polyangiaceae bacterium]MCW5792678.1 class I SAM-dependent methyltransferase [Polyangiaceae bacterium]